MIVRSEWVEVPFEGEGRGVEELSWGQRELWGGMTQQGSWFPIGMTYDAPEDATVERLVANLSFLVGRHQTMRTRLRLDPDGPKQVVSASGAMRLEVVDAADDEDPAAVAAAVERRYRETDYDFVAEWPVRVAAVRHRNQVTHYIMIMCHLVADSAGARAMQDDLRARDPVTGEAASPPPAMQPLAQARWQRSPDGQRVSDTAIRRWEGLLRKLPARRFPGSPHRHRPRFWQARLDSPATLQSLRRLAPRTRVDTSTVLLALFAVSLARVTGLHPVATRVLVDNRFRSGLAGVVAPVSQPGLCVIDVAGATVDEVIARVRRATLAAYKHAYFDSFKLEALIYQIDRERGEPLDISCYFNDQRRPEYRQVTGPQPAPEEILAARSAGHFAWGRRQDRPTERLFLHVTDVPDTVGVSAWADTDHLPPDQFEAVLRGMEAVAVAAALDPGTRTQVSTHQEAAA